MPVTTPDTVARENFGPVEVGTADLDGYTVNVLHFAAPVDMDQMLRGLPGNICPCPHWGIVTDGRMIVRYADHQETVETGDVFYMAPGHVPDYAAGTRLIQFSPTEEMKIVDEVITRNARALQGA
jgi:hypothetical protein